MDLKALLRANADRVTAAGLLLAGAAAIVLGWVGVSGTGLAAQQIPYLVSGGLGGVVLVIVGCTAWVSADLGDEWRKLEAIERRLADLAEASRAPKAASAPATMTAGELVDAPATNGRSPRRPRKVNEPQP